MGSSALERGRAERRPVLFALLLSLFSPARSEQIRYRIPEEMPKGSVVGNLAKDLGFSVQELPARKLRVSSEKPSFAVSTESGELLVSSRLDREQLCGKRPACVLEFEAVSEDPLNFYHVSVEIEDINDHAPKFMHVSFELQISESAQPGTRFILGSARDADIGTNALQNYQLSPNDHFSLTNKEKSDGSKYPEMILKTPLDREKQNLYHLTLTAIDCGDPPLSSTAQIHVLVTDANDNPPVFSQDIYRVSLPENVYPGTTVLQVTATDQDEGVNAEITFSFSEASQITMFDLNSNTGEVTTLNTLDFEEVKEYSIILEARDGGGMIAQCTVEIEILDENDNVPQVIFQSLPNLIMEDAELGTHIALLKIRDKDSGHNGEVICKLEGEVPFANVSLRVLVGDLNDNAPRVLYPALAPDDSALFDTVPRAAEPGYLVTKVVAVDADSGHNAWLSYHVLQASDPGLFSLGLRTGEVRTARALGDKDAARHRLLVAVRDGGQPPLSATATLHLVFADSLQEVLPDLREEPVPSDPQAELQFYLVVALALISVLFLLAVILAIALRLRHTSSPTTWGCFPNGPCSKPVPVVPPNYSEGTLPYSFNLCVEHMGKTEFNFQKCSDPLSSRQDILCGDSSGALFPFCNSSESTSHPETLTPDSERRCSPTVRKTELQIRISIFVKPLLSHKLDPGLQQNSTS
nr:protocadherin gamma-B4-like [Cavia porcellus]